MKFQRDSSWHILAIITTFASTVCTTNLPPSFRNDMNNLAVSENTPIGKVIFILEGTDPENSSVYFGLTGIDLLNVDANTGKITVVKPLDYEINDTLNFFLTIEDEVEDAPIGGNNVVEIPVTVIVLDENDNVPTFKNVPYTVLIAEDTPVGTTIFSNVHVTDADTVGNSLEVECLNLPNFANACNVFDVVTIDATQNHYHGALVLKRKLNFTLEEEYQMLLKTTDGKLNSNTTIVIKVGDVQNSPPIFIGSLHAEVNEDIPINTLILTVYAEDGDRGLPRKVVYELVDDPMHYFVLDTETGELRIARPLDREAVENPTGLLLLKIRASELVNGTKGTDVLTVTDTEASVIIKDVNDEPPSFNKNDFHVEIPEDAGIGYTLPNLKMIVSDSDTGNNSIFALTLDDILHVFSVEPKVVEGSSSVDFKVVNSSLDYEDPNQRKFIVLVVAKEVYTNPQLSSTATVTVTVTDANDNAPTFDLPLYSADLSEIASAGTLVITIIAKDKDSGKFGENGVVYQLAGSGSENFSINNRTGVVTVRNCSELGYKECLDYETKQEYNLLFKATDNDGKGHTTVVPLTIILTDSNDNSPTFNQSMYNVFVDEEAVKFESDVIIEAKDLDKTSHVTYSIIAGNLDNFFNIDPKTGKLRITSSKGLPFNGDANKNSVILTIEATDGKYTTSTIVNITVRDVNNNFPKFDNDNYMVYVSEDANIGTSIFQIKVTDADAGINAEIRYELRKGTFNHFAINSHTGVVTVASKLDYDHRDTYNIEVAAADQGLVSLTSTALLTVRIVNINNKAPYFAPTVQKAEVMKNARTGTVVHTLVAFDPDVNSTVALNFAAVEPITAVNKYGQIVDNDIFKDFFSVDKNTGTVLISNILQRDVAAVINIPVIVTDTTAPTVQQGKGTLIITITDINDRPPKFLPPWTSEKPEYTLKLQEELPVGTIVATYTAVDEDSAIGGYYIIPENKYFEINNGTGILQIKERIDYEKIDSVDFTIIAFDSGMPQLNASVVVHVVVLNLNDNVPEFSAIAYNATVKENSSNGTHIITVKANDLDVGEYGLVSYSLTGQHSENFLISSDSGEIFVANSEFLDRELLNETVIQVVASDSAPGNLKHSISVPVYIAILDVNDNVPKFNQSNYNVTITENLRINPPMPIVQVIATDIDEGTNGIITYWITSGNQNDTFLLGEDTGILYARKSLQGKANHFVLEVEARDGAGSGEFTDKTTVYIHVTNVNEHKPKFVRPSSPNDTVVLTQTVIPADHLLMTVKAVDEDNGENGRLTYHFKIDGINAQETNEFIINAHTGELKTKSLLDCNLRAEYTLILAVRDHGLPVWYESVCYVTIFIQCGENNEETFSNSEHNNVYHFYSAENTKQNTLIGQVKSFQPKEDKFTKLYYYLLSGNENHAFYIDKFNGGLYTNKMLDREDRSEYELEVLANNESDFYINTKSQNMLYNETIQKSIVMQVKITINDLNDNSPMFEKLVHYAAVNAMTAINNFFANVTAIDPDFGVNGSLMYYIKTSNLYKYGSNISSGSIIPSPFNISEAGQLFTTACLTENNQHHFVMDVIAKEVAYPEREAFTKVYVWIFVPDQLIRIILSRSKEDVLVEKDEIIAELSNVTTCIVIIYEVKDHIKDNGFVSNEWCDMYILVVNRQTQAIMPVHDILKVIDAKYDFLKDYYAGFAIENVVPAFAMDSAEEFDPAVSALIALILVLVVGILTFTVVCCCIRRMVSSNDLKKKDALINKAVMDDLNTTENPLWIEQKLKIYEEQELSMQVFNEPEQAMLERTNSGEFLSEDNTYATIQQSGQRGPVHTASLSLAGDVADYATLSRLPHNSSTTNFEAAMGFQGSTFQVPKTTGDKQDFCDDDYISYDVEAETPGYDNGQLEYVAQLI